MPVTRSQVRRSRERRSPLSPSSPPPPRRRRRPAPSAPPRIPAPAPASTFPSPFLEPSPTTPIFGLIQERLPTHTYPLLVQAILWNQTTGRTARPVLAQLLTRYPTPRHLALAPLADLVALLQPIGLHNVRADRLGKFARRWLEAPPCPGRRWRRLGYPRKGDGGDIRPGEALGIDDERVGWEVAHLPGVGAYALDSWRIFGRDALRRGMGGVEEGTGLVVDGEMGVVKVDGDEGVKTEAAGMDCRVKLETGGEIKSEVRDEVKLERGEADQEDDDGDPGEWRLVVPEDKELRRYLVWRWRRCGWVWDPLTGKRRRLRKDEEEHESGDGGDAGDKLVDG